MQNRFEKMSKLEIVAAIKICEQAVIKLQEYSTDLEAGRALPKDKASREQLIESNAKNIRFKTSELKELNDELGRRI